MDEKEKAKRFVSKSRRTKPKHGSVTGKMKSKCRKSKKKKSSTTSKSNSAVSPHRENETKEEKKGEAEKKIEPHEKKKSDQKVVKEIKEPDTESDHDADLGMKRSHVILPNRKGKPQKVAIKHHEVDEKEMERLLKKLQEKKAEPPRVPVTLDEKSKILMDRVEKKTCPTKYLKKNKWSRLADEDDADFFKPTKVMTKKSSATVIPVEDKYDHVPKLADVLKMRGENIYQMTLMGEVPFWAVYLEPDEADSKDVEPPISVGSDHVEAYQNKTITLKTQKSTKLVLDEFQPSCILTTRDEKFFHPHLIFSNTVRSLINVQGHEEKSAAVKSPMTKSDDDGENEESTQPDDVYNVTFSKKPLRSFIYERSRPILSAREEKEKQSRPKQPPVTGVPCTVTPIPLEKRKEAKT